MRNSFSIYFIYNSKVLTRQSSNVHFLEVLGFQHYHSQLSGIRNIPKGEANISQLKTIDILSNLHFYMQLNMENMNAQLFRVYKNINQTILLDDLLS
jgi:hypothetical protein